ncbi:MAG: 2OG-Fe(II) oxygenase [Synechococcaceae bacterium WB4_1_0192]|nr:2OG-Fe(II) oxygenase [Synechococcaceae bacterium WB4_1_0192]
MQLSDLVRVYPGRLSIHDCQALIDGFEQRAADHVIHQGEGAAPRFTELNLTQCWDEGHDLAFGAILPVFEAYSRDIQINTAQWPEELAFEELRMKRYWPNGDDEFPEHVDVGDHASARRFLAALLYLNDVADGGDTEFPLWGQHIHPQAGSVLVFPPLWPWLHAGRPPVSATKYILSTYLHYT